MVTLLCGDFLLLQPVIHIISCRPLFISLLGGYLTLTVNFHLIFSDRFYCTVNIRAIWWRWSRKFFGFLFDVLVIDARRVIVPEEVKFTWFPVEHTSSNQYPEK